MWRPSRGSFNLGVPSKPEERGMLRNEIRLFLSRNRLQTSR